MTRRIRFHFDGRVLVPDQPVDLPINQPMEADVRMTGEAKPNGAPDAALVQDRRKRLRQSAGAFSAPVLSDEALRRENMYDERA